MLHLDICIRINKGSINKGDSATSMLQDSPTGRRHPGLVKLIQETQLSLTNRATRLEVSQDHQTIRYARYGFLSVFYSNFIPNNMRRF